MSMKEKAIGAILIVVGALPFLLKIEAVNEAIGQYTWILPGEIVYQAVLIILGLVLFFKRKPQSGFIR